ncbi:acetyl-CoA carboxylase carboxyltransferase subunit alpha [Tengunoibacter tsumagoiensis]|uniref:Acetyl-coenzyme A carboxylase carboxyl transferase subunit alpha n=1 Tax=Tengunoibacter tsumagoiensis TaxID=2014871 RepID=A0A401ZYP7_9CHLR|nr:acetyl-CoA carboxylase carboxyltransferase subunit alpha [Tengunoibacter tsumagoiensis]GCE11988.1 acetyl-coenzyme A carboxylase carboxyl transferase subunit alpha [Tengunoibacter tsumagoiensis]
MAYDLEFEKPLAELDKKISALQRKGDRLKPDEVSQLQELERELRQRTEEIYKNLSSWQTVAVARHKDRPYSADYIRLLFDDFFELHGDRSFGDDHAIMAGPAKLGDETVMLLCHQKGRDMKEKQFRNLGMSHPEGYRKACRLMQQAEKFHIPIISLIDASGASVALVDEERGQAEAIASSLYIMSRINVPIIAVVIGEGGSGGALAISVADRILMLEHSIYTVAAPEAAASILWRDSAYAAQAAEGMRIRASDLKELGLIDEIVPEPLGAAHRNYAQMCQTLKQALQANLAEIKQLSPEVRLEQRYQKFRSIGQFGRLEPAQDALPSENSLNTIQ